MVRPVPLALETADDGVVAERLLAEAQFRQTRVAYHQIARNHRHLHHRFPFPILARASCCDFGGFQSLPSLQFARVHA